MQLNQIIRGNNIDILRDLLKSNTKFDLILTDPPYNVGKDFGNETDKQNDDDFAQFIVGRVNYAIWLLKEKGSIVWFCSHKYVDLMRYQFGNSVNYQRMLIWYYRNGLSRQTNSPVTEYEPILWFTKDAKEWTYNADDIRIPYRSQRVKNPVYKTNKKGEKVAWNPDPRGAKRGDVWEYPALAGALYKNERTEHPTQKPLSLVTDLLKAFLPKNADGKYSGTVLDPFLGSGTTIVACAMLNKLGHDIKYIGIELEQKWVDVAHERLSALSDGIFDTIDQ